MKREAHKKIIVETTNENMEKKIARMQVTKIAGP